YSFRAIAILCRTQKATEEFYQILEPALKRQVRKYRVRLVFRTAVDVLGNVIVPDSIQHFSGLESSIVFGTHPMPAQREISLIFYCVAYSDTSTIRFLKS
uniref:Uncharacterized protein n=1 Tax=Apteryx owenii TaxID=8824 RepID=A0A8B9PU22_APTOW